MFFDLLKYLVLKLPSNLIEVLFSGNDIGKYDSPTIYQFLKQNELSLNYLLHSLISHTDGSWEANIYKLILLQHKNVLDKFVNLDAPEFALIDNKNAKFYIARNKNVIYIKTKPISWKLHTSYKILNDISFLAAASESETLEVYYSSVQPKNVFNLHNGTASLCIVNYIKSLLQQIKNESLYNELLKALCAIISELYSLLLYENYKELYNLLLTTIAMANSPEKTELHVYGNLFHLPVYIPFYCDITLGKQILKGFTINANAELNMYWKIVATENELIYSFFLPYDISKPNIVSNKLVKNLLQLKNELCLA